MGVLAVMLFLVGLTALGAEANPLLIHKPEINKQDQESSSNLNSPEIDHYDQRQNGTENYRVKVDGLVFILAPAETLLLGAALDPSFSSMLSEKPKPKPDLDLFKPKPGKDDSHKTGFHESFHGTKSGLRISNLIQPFLNRIRHSQTQLSAAAN